MSDSAERGGWVAVTEVVSVAREHWGDPIKWSAKLALARPGGAIDLRSVQSVDAGSLFEARIIAKAFRESVAGRPACPYSMTSNWGQRNPHRDSWFAGVQAATDARMCRPDLGDEPAP